MARGEVTLLDGVRCNGDDVPGARAGALLRALALAGRRVVADARLVEQVWGESPPANPTKALQVQVSRLRSAYGEGLLVREHGGYRLGPAVEDVDLWRLEGLAGLAERSLASGDATAAGEAAARALDLAPDAADVDGNPELDERVRRARGAATRVGALAASRRGEHAAALPLLEAALAERPDDEQLLVVTLRSEAAVRGAGAALERYEAHRLDLAERTGSDPGDDVRRLHAELLALDRPVRAGVRFDTTELVGRERDLASVRALIGTGRVTSIVGPGGLGKTRLAHVLAREADQPVVHVVELVGVSDAADVVGEVGSALGVRDSVTGRSTLTPAQRADVRSRIVAHLAAAPTLLVLDNAEHVVEEVAELVAFLVASTRDLHVLVTTRAPLGVAAERVHLLAQLTDAEGVELFAQRARAARASIRLDDGEVRALVARLDGLPLAIELAAARTRALSVGQITARLDDRFALLRSDDRGAPDRHRTLLAVIDWSWALLGPSEQSALCRLALFHDGFSLEGAEAVLAGRDDGAPPPDVLAVLEHLVAQSLLSVVEGDDGLRYRMLETVREFGVVQLDRAGEREEAASAHRGWATGLALAAGADLYGPRQLEVLDELRAEEANLGDVLRRALTHDDTDTVVAVMAALGGYWTIGGDHARVLGLNTSLTAALSRWTPTAELADAARAVLAIVLSTGAMVFYGQAPAALRALLDQIGVDSDIPLVRAQAEVARAIGDYTPALIEADLRALLERDDLPPVTRMVALQWSALMLENLGDVAGAVRAADLALGLWSDDVGPWSRAALGTQLAQLEMQRGHVAAAEAHAREALPALERVRAFDDLLSVRALLVSCALLGERLDEADDLLAQLTSAGHDHNVIAGPSTVLTTRAEVALARGRRAEGLALYRESLSSMAAVRIPVFQGDTPVSRGFAPWELAGEAAALAAHARHAPVDGADTETGADLFERVRDRAGGFLGQEPELVDYPVAGMMLFALGAWGLRHDALAPGEVAALVAVAEGFGYNRAAPSLAPGSVVDRLEEVAPGVLTEARARHAGRRGAALALDARSCLAALDPRHDARAGGRPDQR